MWARLVFTVDHFTGDIALFTAYAELERLHAERQMIYSAQFPQNKSTPDRRRVRQ